MEINIERIIEFVENVYGENNHGLIKSTLLEMGIDVDEAAQQMRGADCSHEWDTDETGEFCVRCYERKS